MDLFEFKKQLYLISNHLSTDEVRNLVFICGSIIPRRQQERIRTGFELFCVLADKNNISATNVQFLRQILDSVGKGHLTQPLFERGGGRGVEEAREWYTPPAEAQPIEYDNERLEPKFNVMLVGVADELSDRNIRDIALFFCNPAQNLGLQEVEHLRSARDLFKILKDNQVIGFTDLQKLRFVLEVIGRYDACRKIDTYMTQTKDFIKTPSASCQDAQAVAPFQEQGEIQHLRQKLSEIEKIVTSTQREVSNLRGQLLQAEAGPVPPTGHYSSGSAANSMNSQFSGISSGTLTSFSMPSGINTSSTSVSGSSGAPSSYYTNSTGTQQQQPSEDERGSRAIIVHGTCSTQLQLTEQIDSEPMSMDSTSTKQSRPATGELQRKDDQIQWQQGEIERLRKKINEIEKEEKKFRHAQIQSLSSELEKKIKEVNSTQSEVKHLRELLQAENALLYKMECNPHGLAVIIVNEKFVANPVEPEVKLGPREGAQKDLQLFTELFRELGYKIVPHTNLTALQMYEVLDEVRKVDHTNYDSFVCCISTHGDEHMMYGSDSVGVKRTEFDRPLKQCPTLRGKPKMFFIQACRTVPHSQMVDCPSQLIAPTPSLDADMFVANATTASNLSYRSPRDGSWFVTALHHTFINSAHYQTLDQMMYKVNTVICDADGILLNTSSDQPGETIKAKQCAEWTTSFRNGVRFIKPRN